jgi:hypothetical protein
MFIIIQINLVMTFLFYSMQGFVPSLEFVAPGAEHRICCRHLYANYRDVGHKGLALKDKLWTAAAAYTEAEWTREMEELKSISPDAYEYLSNIDPSTWSRAWFSTFPKCDLIVNNLSECFNAWILKQHDLPIISLLEMLRKKLLKRYQKKREGIVNMDGRICPKILARLDELAANAGHCYGVYAGDGFYEITDKQKQYVVNLVTRSCGCRQWDMAGIPCAHAMCAIWLDGGEPMDYVSHWYTMDMLKKAFEPIVYPMPGEEQWTKTNCEHINPPMVRIQPGRPRVVRTRGPDEPRNQYRMRKGGVTMRCSRCRRTGHNARTYPRTRIEAVNYRGQSRSDVNSLDIYFFYFLLLLLFFVFGVILNFMFQCVRYNLQLILNRILNIPHKPMLHRLEVPLGVGVGVLAGVRVNQLQGTQLQVEVSLKLGPMLR